MKILEKIKLLLGFAPKPKEITKVEKLLYLREILKTKNCFMCVQLYAHFQDRDILVNGLKNVLPELYNLRPSGVEQEKAWGTKESISNEYTTDEEISKIWNYRKWAVESAIIMIETPSIVYKPYM